MYFLFLRSKTDQRREEYCYAPFVIDKLTSVHCQKQRPPYLSAKVLIGQDMKVIYDFWRKL